MRVIIKEWHPDAGIRRVCDTDDVRENSILDVSGDWLLDLCRRFDVKLIHRPNAFNSGVDYVVWLDKLGRNHTTR